MGTKADPGPYDCYARAEPDEPMFVLLARDKWAPFLVMLWAILRLADGEDQTVTSEAGDVSDAMIIWARAHGRKPMVGPRAMWIELFRKLANDLEREGKES